jgi:hypothetical protein
MKTIGINLVGISHLLHNQRWPISRSYLECKENFLQELHTPIKKLYNVKNYITTYISSESQNILDFYKPEKALLLNYNKSHQINTFISSIQMLENEKLDLVIITRFDMLFKPNALVKLVIHGEKFNFLCKEKDHWDNFNFVNDCFYILPFSMIPCLKQACLDLLNNPPRPGLMDMHGLYKCLLKYLPADKINFLINDHYLSTDNPLYTLKRYNS